MKNSQSQHEVSLRQLRIFGLSLLMGFGMLGFLAWLRLQNNPKSMGPQGLDLFRVPYLLWALAIVGVILPWIWIGGARATYAGWMRMAAVLSRVMVPVGLTVVFVLLLPWFVWIRFSDPLRKRMGDAETYWEPSRTPEPTLERMARPF